MHEVDQVRYCSAHVSLQLYHYVIIYNSSFLLITSCRLLIWQHVAPRSFWITVTTAFQ